MQPKSTRLRHISAKDAGALEDYLQRLPFKVEIKGGPVARDGRWFLFFVLPEDDRIQLQSQDL